MSAGEHSFCVFPLAMLWSRSGFIMSLWWGANGASFLCSPSCVFFFTSTFIACLFWLVLYHCAVEFHVRNGRLSIHPLYFHRTEAIAEWMTSLFCNDPHHPSVISQDNWCMVSLLYDICVKLRMWDISPAWMKMVWQDKVKNYIIHYYYNIVWVLWFYGYFNIYLDTVKEVFYVHKNYFETILMKSV